VFLPTGHPSVSPLDSIMAPAADTQLGYKPLDGGWGWMVVVGAHISIGFAYSMPKVLSVFFIDIQQQLGASSSEVAWISSIMLAVMYAGGESVHRGMRNVEAPGGARGYSPMCEVREEEEEGDCGGEEEEGDCGGQEEGDCEEEEEEGDWRGRKRRL